MNDLRVKRTYKLLKQALYELLETKSFDEIKVNDLCEVAMIHRTTFYSHFSDKYDLLYYCIKDVKEELLSKLRNQPYTNIEEFYTNMISGLLKYIGDNKSFFKKMLNKNYETGIISTLKNTCTSFIIEMLEKEELNEIHHPYNISLIAEFYSGAVTSTISWWILYNNNLSEKKLCENIIDLIFKKTKSFSS